MSLDVRAASFAWPTLDKLAAQIDRSRAGWVLLGLALLGAVLAYRTGYTHHFAVVKDPAFPDWWDWSDQGRYYTAVKAWAEGSLDPARHWYFAGYPLLGAAMFRLSPGHPFYWVDLAGLLLLGLAVTLLAGRLAVRPGIGRAIGALTFFVTVVMTPYAMKSFIEPWNTTPTAPLTLAALLLAFRVWDRPGVGRAAAAGMATASIVMFRPVDVLPLAIAVAGSTAWALRAQPARVWCRVAGGALLGASPPACLAAGSYLAIFGLERSTYLLQSAQTGFEWRLIPLHWVTLFVSPLPEFRDDFSLAQTFLWIVPGVAGMVACLVARRGVARLRHALIIAAVGLHCLLYLAYRDLHPPGLFHFGNYHYFRWCVPVFGLYAVLLATEILRSPRRLVAWASGLAVAALLFSWRMEWRDVSAPWLADASVAGEHTLILPQAPRSVMDGLFVPAAAGPAQIYLSSYEMWIGQRMFGANADFKAFPVDGGLIFTVLRPMPPGQATIIFAALIDIVPGPLQMRRAHLFWRWPHPIQVARAYAGHWLRAGRR